MKKLLKMSFLTIVSLLLTMLSCKGDDNAKQKEKFYKNLSLRVTHRMFEQMKSNGEKFFDLNDTTQNQKKVISSLKEGNKLIFRFTPSHCGKCVDSTLLNINKFVDKHNLSDKILIMPAFTNDRDLFMFSREKKVPFEIVNIEEKEMTLNIKEEIKPYLFVTDSTLIAKSVFLPMKEIPSITRKYFKHIKDTYFSKEKKK